LTNKEDFKIQLSTTGTPIQTKFRQKPTIIMTDAGRKGMGDKLSESVKPDSQKSTFEKGQEAVTDAGDKVAG
jgi:Heat shock protein 9/12